jgi:hypothetical protein
MTAVRQQHDTAELPTMTPVIAAHFDKAATSYCNAATLQQLVSPATEQPLP